MLHVRCIFVWIMIELRGVPIRYSVSVSLRYWYFLPDQGIGQTRPIQIQYSVLLLSPTKAQKHYKAP